MYDGGRGGGGGRGGVGSGGMKERVFTPKGQMSSGANQRSALQDLPPNLRMMFEPRVIPIPSIIQKEEKKLPPYNGIGQFVSLFEKVVPPPAVPIPTLQDRKNKMKEKMLKLNNEKNELLMSDYDPHSYHGVSENAYHTLFVTNLSYDTTEKKLRREFEQYGKIKSVKIVQDLQGKPRGYAFVEFEKEEEMTTAVRRGDGKKIDGRRVLLDVERGRTVRNWRPMRLGGGLGGRKPIKSKKQIEDENRKALLSSSSDPSGRPKSTTVYGPGGSERNDRNESRVNDRDSRDGGDRYRGNERDSRGGDRGGDSRRGSGRSRSRERDNNRGREENRNGGGFDSRRYGGGNDDYRNVPPPSTGGSRNGRRSRSRERR
eukprot:gene10583-14216_t